MYERIIGQTLGKVTKLLLASAGPLQYFLDTPGVTHVHCLDQNPMVRFLPDHSTERVVEHMLQLTNLEKEQKLVKQFFACF
jgi:hypothetical protein